MEMNWISVDDGLPIEIGVGNTKTVTVLVTDGENVSMCDFMTGPLPKPWREWSQYGGVSAYKITHWMELPKAPVTE